MVIQGISSIAYLCNNDNSNKGIAYLRNNDKKYKLEIFLQSGFLPRYYFFNLAMKLLRN